MFQKSREDPNFSGRHRHASTGKAIRGYEYTYVGRHCLEPKKFDHSLALAGHISSSFILCPYYNSINCPGSRPRRLKALIGAVVVNLEQIE